MTKLQHNRRKELEHSDECPMPQYTHLNCECHYTYCLDYSDLFRGCICEELTAKERYAKYMMWRMKLLRRKRAILWFRKPTVSWSEFIYEDLPRKLWY